MTDPSLGTKKKKVTCTASPQGVERAENALKRLGFDSKSNFAKSQLLARNTVTKFFQHEPIQLDSFKRICEALKLNWREIALITEEEQSKRLERNDCSISETNEEVEAVQTLRRQVTVTDKQSKRIKAEIILKGDINSVYNFKILQLILQEHSGDTIEITDIKEGSIRIIVKGSQEDIERLISQFKSKELTEVSGFPVENVQILSDSSDDDENNESDDKWRLVQEIVTQPTKGQNLSGADLSDADLSGAILSSADLSDADLSDADLSDANLSFANLSGANLSGANLSGTDLSRTNLKGATINKETQINRNWLLVWGIINQGAVGQDLSNANLSYADLSSANLRGAILSNAILILADLSNANLRGADLSGADLRGAILSNANLRGADLSDAILSNAILSGAFLSDAILSSADLSRADLSRAILSSADLSDAILSGAFLSGAFLSDAILSSADLSGADLSRAILSSADLSGAILSSADLSSANLKSATVVNALFGGGKGLTQEMKRDLEQRGAIFSDR